MPATICDGKNIATAKPAAAAEIYTDGVFVFPLRNVGRAYKIDFLNTPQKFGAKLVPKYDTTTDSLISRL